MMSTNPRKKPETKNLLLIPGIVAACLLFAAGTIQLLFEEESPTPTTIPSTATIPRINIPSIEYPTITPSAPSYTLPIDSIGTSGVTGTITFEDIAGVVAILLHLDGLPEEEIVPVELRHGSCAEPGAVAYPLFSPDAGESETDLSINLAEFNTQKPLAVVVYLSADDPAVIACGDIP